MAKDQNLVQSGPRRRGGVVTPAAPTAVAKKRVTPVQFLREVRAEARKVTWTTWKETWITSVMVAIMVVLTAFFFSGLDGVLSFVMRGVLKLAGRRLARFRIDPIMSETHAANPNHKWVHRPRLLELREEGGREHPRAGP